MLQLIKNILRLSTIVLILFDLDANAATGLTRFFDDFYGNSIDESVWQYPTGSVAFNGRTQMRSYYPNVYEDVLQLQLDTYNKNAEPAGRSFLGAEIMTREVIPSKTGLTVEIRARMRTPVKGTVGGLFLYNLFSLLAHDEIDFELLGNRRDEVQTNIYAGEALGPGHALFHRLTQFDIANFNIYKMECWQDRILWYVNDQLIRETALLMPINPANLHLNFYAPEEAWTAAYDKSLMPTANPLQNQTYFFDVDWVSVACETAPKPQCLFDLQAEMPHSFFAMWTKPKSCSPRQLPIIEFTSVPEYGEFKPLKGSMSYAHPDAYRIAFYIKTASGWWTKPFYNEPAVAINKDGTFEVTITTGDGDQNATEITGFIVPADFNPPLINGDASLPDMLYAYPNASVARVKSTKAVNGQ